METEGSYRPRKKKSLIGLKGNKDETSSSCCQETQKKPTRLTFSPARRLKSDFWGSKSHLLVTFDSRFAKKGHLVSFESDK